MRQNELRRSLSEVREYFTGGEVSVNTVLAAHLRSHGVPASGQPWMVAKRAMAEGADFQEAVLVAAEGASDPSEVAGTPENERPTPYEGDSLEWFAKRFGPGDIDGVGAKRLLGTPNISGAAVLVRETGQNSWDARGNSDAIEFTINLRDLDEELVQLLGTRIFPQESDHLGLMRLFRQGGIRALEIADRGTVGLGGPIRNDLGVEAGEDTNFIDLVLNVGAPRDVHLGAGTYGFGKTISYVVSGVSTVLIWSRSEGSSGLEHRLIGSAIGNSFNMGGHRYTGRHWWGNAIWEEGRVEPVTGELARELGERAFGRHFTGVETGTSILILAPDLGGDSSEDDMARLEDAIVDNLWPKLLRDQRGTARMDISLQRNGIEHALPPIEEHSTLSGYARCLHAVRAAQSPRANDATDPSGVEVREIRSERPRKLLGHLALTRFPTPPHAGTASHSVALMRSQAELVVKYFERRELDVDGFQWAGVFKPAEEVDDSFAAAEPPAHDDWVPSGVPDKRQRRDVNVALRRIREETDLFLGPGQTDHEASDHVPSAALVGDMLADLVAGIDGSAPTTRKNSSERSHGGGARGRRPRVSIVDVHHAPSAPGWTLTTVELELSEAGPMGAAVGLDIRVGVDGAALTDSEAVRDLGWVDATDVSGGTKTLYAGQNHSYAYEARSDLAIEIQARVEA